jgi:hypothetical protein
MVVRMVRSGPTAPRWWTGIRWDSYTALLTIKPENAQELALLDCWRLVRDEVPQGVGCVVTADAVFVRVNLQDILRASWIMLEGRDGLD